MVIAIKRRPATFTKAILWCALSCWAGIAAASPTPRADWTLEDIVTAPEVTDIKFASDEDYALYIVRIADVGRDQDRSDLRRVDLADGTQTTLLNAKSLKRLQRIPNSPDWSALADLGDGQQLYRIDIQGKIAPLILNSNTVLVGSADQAVHTFDVQAPVAVGIASYDWSPDGNWLWYSQLRKSDGRDPVLFDEAVVAQRDQIRPPVRAEVDFYLRSLGGDNRLVASRPVTDFLAFRYGGRVRWDKDKVRYRTATPDGKGSFAYQSYAWDFDGNTVRKDDEQTVDDATFAVWGVNGGRLATEGVGWNRKLVETRNDGTRFDFGEKDFSVGDMRAAGSFLSADGKRAIVGTRDVNALSYGLALIEGKSARQLAAKGSFTKCDFERSLALGLCIRQGLTLAPEIVKVQPWAGKVVSIGSVSQRHADLAKLNVLPRTWTNRLGYKATGFVLLPAGYDASKRYPTIFVTHGNDADQRFAAPDFQWNYPVQYLAQAGYLVVMINDANSYQEKRLFAALMQQITGEGDVSPAELQKLWWLNEVYSIEDAARDMAKEGLVDLDRVGIAGYSRGSQIVNVATTQSKLFKAGSSGDGSHLEPLTYKISPQSFDRIFGGPPFGDNFKNYEKLSPSLRAGQACAAVLFQMAGPFPGNIDYHTALRAAGVPAQISLYPGETPASDETHIFHIPSNRLDAMRENVAWFDFWLRGQKSALVAPERLQHWQDMKDAQSSKCSASPANGP